VRPGPCPDAPPEAAGAPGTVTYGLNFQAWRVFLMVMHHIPVERCADILASMSGTRPSDGWVHALLGHAARTVGAGNTAIRGLIVAARVISGDETPLRAWPGPKSAKMYLQVACTSLLTHYFLGGRDLPSFKDFVYSDLSGTIVVHDRYQNYDSIPRHLPSAVLRAPAAGSGGRCPELSGRDLARPGRRRASRPDPGREPGL
jgi:transposase